MLDVIPITLWPEISINTMRDKVRFQRIRTVVETRSKSQTFLKRKKMKLLIKDLERILNCKIRRDFKSIGFDTAKRTGICWLDVDKTHIVFDWCFIETEGLGNHKLIYKAMVEKFSEIIGGQDLAVVEQVFVGFSRAGSVELARYSSFVISECIHHKVPYELISATSARSKLEIKTVKGKSKESVANWLRQNLKLELKDEDISDAIVLALLGIIDGMDFRSQVAIKKDK